MNTLPEMFGCSFELTFLLALTAFGFVVGILTGLFGVGGGFMIVPLLNVLFGVKYPIAVGSSLCFTIGTGTAGVMAHRRANNIELKSLVYLSIFAIIGAVLGADLQHYLEEAIGEGNKEYFDSMMAGLFIVMLLTTAWILASGAGREKHGKSFLQRIAIPPRIDLPKAGLKDVSLTGICAAGLMVGVLKGLLGIGGGVLYMPLLIVVIGLTPHQAVGTSLGVVLFSSIAGTIKHGLMGNVDLWIAMSLLVGSSIGVQLGVWVCDKLHAKKLKQYFVILVLFVAILLAADLIKKITS